MEVSIQLLFLFNELFEWEDGNPNEFQYSFCSYSTIIGIITLSVKWMFQYSFCSYSTVIQTYEMVHWKQFQYSFCSYSTTKDIPFFSSLRFNTASVLIQPTTPVMIGDAASFQYSFCSYSTCRKSSVYYLLQSFQYSFCSYSTAGSGYFFFLTPLFQYSFCSYSTVYKKLRTK